MSGKIISVSFTWGTSTASGGTKDASDGLGDSCSSPPLRVQLVTAAVQRGSE